MIIFTTMIFVLCTILSSVITIVKALPPNFTFYMS